MICFRCFSKQFCCFFSEKHEKVINFVCFDRILSNSTSFVFQSGLQDTKSSHIPKNKKSIHNITNFGFWDFFGQKTEIVAKFFYFISMEVLCFGTETSKVLVLEMSNGDINSYNMIFVGSCLTYFYMFL